MKTIEEINQNNVKKILSEKKIPDFFPGDVVKVGVRITEGKKERIQYFEGVCIAKKSRDINSSFTVRKISFGEGVERTFPLYGTVIDSIKVIRSGKVRRALLTFPERITLIESITVPYNGKVLSTPSPKDIFLTVKEEFMSLLFLAIQTPSKY